MLQPGRKKKEIIEPKWEFVPAIVEDIYRSSNRQNTKYNTFKKKNELNKLIKKNKKTGELPGQTESHYFNSMFYSLDNKI